MRKLRRIKNYQATHRLIVEKLIDALMEELLTEIGSTTELQPD